MPREISDKKKYGVVYTPPWVVKKILDKTLPTKNWTTLKICDPACGSGHFLVELVSRFAANLRGKELHAALQNNIVGMDIDDSAVKECRKNLDNTLSQLGITPTVQWNIHCLDSLDKNLMKEYLGGFDIVIGNPPYIRIQHLGETRKKKIQNEWSLAAHGCSDIYIAFFQLGLELLNNDGRLGFITPNTYTKTAAGKLLRQYLQSNKLIRRLIDFGEHQIFPGWTTYTLITILDKGKRRSLWTLDKYNGKSIEPHGALPIEKLDSERWALCDKASMARIERIKKRGMPLKRIASINVGIQTLADNIFILEKIGETAKFIVAKTAIGQTIKLEKSLTLPILKVSVMKNGKDKKERILLCPYQEQTPPPPINENAPSPNLPYMLRPRQEQTSSLIGETVLQKNYPHAYRYLLENKSRLLARDKGNIPPHRWYAFGREINIAKTLGDKILTSGMNKTPNFFKCPSPNYTFYSGYAIKATDAAIDNDALLPHLNSADMEFFIQHTSSDFQNGWKSYAKSFIQDFGVALK